MSCFPPLRLRLIPELARWNIIGQFDLFRFELLMMRKDNYWGPGTAEISVVMPRMLHNSGRES